jgi:hypothetical protein
MIPIGTCDSRLEALKFEKWAIRKFMPNLNRPDVPIWMHKQGYWRDEKMKVHRPKDTRSISNNRQRVEATRWHPLESDKPTLTLYKDLDNNRLVRDLDILLRWGATHDQGLTIEITPGVFDLTAWNRVKEHFGESYTYRNETPGILKTWNVAEDMKKGGKFKVYINPSDKGTQISRCEAYRIEENFAVTLMERDDDYLFTAWRDRKMYDRHIRKGIETKANVGRMRKTI